MNIYIIIIILTILITITYNFYKSFKKLLFKQYEIFNSEMNEISKLKHGLIEETKILEKCTIENKRFINGYNEFYKLFTVLNSCHTNTIQLSDSLKNEITNIKNITNSLKDSISNIKTQNINSITNKLIEVTHKLEKLK